MDKEKIKELCEQLKDSIDWEYDTYNGYQEMMDEIERLTNEIIKEVNS